MTGEELRILLKRYLDGKASPREQALLEEWYHSQMAKHDFFPYNEAVNMEDIERLKDEIWQRVREGQSRFEPAKKKYIRYPFVAAAAVIFVVVGIGAYVHLRMPASVHTYTAAEMSGQDIDIKPGGNRATLTLADGQVINLSDEQDGIVIDLSALSYTDGTKIIVDDGSIDKAESSDDTFHTITTPKGGQYQVVLADGSRVWLNAASTLKYPRRFASDERTVELVGEAYFEIAQVKSANNENAKPFIVKSPMQDVKVLGTQFNINTYEEDRTETTLLEGAVSIHSVHGNESVRLSPGQQSVVQSGRQTEVLAVDMDKVLGWKNGEFVFYNESIETVMKDIARWYDVEIIYKHPVQNKVIWGSISRFENISEVLGMIELTGVVNFDTQIHGEERMVYVMN